MSEKLSRTVDKMEYDGLIADVTPAVEVRGKTIRKMTTETLLKRGTVLGVSATDKKLVVLGTDGEAAIADCILCDDITVGESEDVLAIVYTAGCFNTNKITAADGYSLTDEDYDNLRKYGIVFKAASAAN